jgi:pilus assembly protein CpaB
MNLKYVARKLLSVNVVLAAVALVAGIGGANAARVYLQTRVDAVEASVALRYKTSAVVVASQDLGLGEVLTSDKLALRSMPRDFLPSSALTQERINGLIGRPLLAALKKGDLLTVAVVQPLMPEALSQLLPVGKRAFTLSVDEVNSRGC